MKFALSIGLLSAFALAACDVDEPPPRRTTQRPAKYPTQQQAQQYPPQPQPFDPNAQPPATTPTTTTDVPPPTNPAPHEETAPSSAPAQSAQTTGKGETAKGDFPYAVPVPGKPGFVRSPYSPDKMTDVRGYAPGTEVKDPYTQKIFLVP